jgi:hypothetical protein
MSVVSRFISLSWFCANFGRDRGPETLMRSAVCPSQHHSTCCWHDHWDWGAPTSEEVCVVTFLQLCFHEFWSDLVRADDEIGIHEVLSRVVRCYYSCSVFCELGALDCCNSEISCETANIFFCHVVGSLVVRRTIAEPLATRDNIARG